MPKELREPVDLDSVDLAVLAALQDNARLPVVELAKRVNLSPTPCTCGSGSWRMTG